MASPVRVGTRGSKLALAQANWVVERLRELAPDHDFTVEVIDSKPKLDPSNPSLGEGIFVKEIQNALLDNRVDVAVHSLKDLPTKPVDGLVVAAVPERADAREAMIGKPLDALPQGAKVGTSSPRRLAQLKRLRPDIDVVALNGNIPTRLEKIARLRAWWPRPAWSVWASRLRRSCRSKRRFRPPARELWRWRYVPDLWRFRCWSAGSTTCKARWLPRQNARCWPPWEGAACCPLRCWQR